MDRAYRPVIVAALVAAGCMIFDQGLRFEYVLLALAGAAIWFGTFVLGRFEALSNFFLRSDARSGWEAKNVDPGTSGYDSGGCGDGGGGDGGGGGGGA